jgi:hypothetical protein
LGQQAKARLARPASMALALAMLTTACGGSGAGAPAAIPSIVEASPRTVNLDGFEGGPEVAMIGVTYPYDLYVHCGGEYAWFGGQRWIADHLPADPGPTPDENGMMIYTGYIAGWMTKLDSVTAIFTFSGSRTPIVFRVTEEEPPLCA